MGAALLKAVHHYYYHDRALGTYYILLYFPFSRAFQYVSLRVVGAPKILHISMIKYMSQKKTPFYIATGAIINRCSRRAVSGCVISTNN